VEFIAITRSESTSQWPPDVFFSNAHTAQTIQLVDDSNNSNRLNRRNNQTPFRASCPRMLPPQCIVQEGRLTLRQRMVITIPHFFFTHIQ